MCVELTAAFLTILAITCRWFKILLRSIEFYDFQEKMHRGVYRIIG